MLLVKPSAHILAMTPGPLGLIEVAGRTCYKSEEKIGPGTDIAFAQMILKNGHESVLEHASATVRFIVDRGVSHEIVRHRIASFSQESTRYCDYEGDQVAFIIPPWCNLGAGTYSRLEDSFPRHRPLKWTPDEKWYCAMMDHEKMYKALRDAGWRPEQARLVLPNSLKTEVVMTANFREWRHFFKLRAAAAAHPQMREVAYPLLDEFASRVPVIFDDIRSAA